MARKKALTRKLFTDILNALRLKADKETTYTKDETDELISEVGNSAIWTYPSEPATPDYTFLIADLTGPAGQMPKVADIIIQGYYVYAISSVAELTVRALDRFSLQGGRGATWYAGTTITGTSTTPTVFVDSGIDDAMDGDHYLNTSTQNVYICTLGGDATTALWKYEQNIKGSQGNPGDGAYMHIKYSNDGGQTFTGNSGEDPGNFIGVYSDETEQDSMVVSDYSWVRIRGDEITTSKAGSSTTIYVNGVAQSSTIDDGSNNFIHVAWADTITIDPITGEVTATGFSTSTATGKQYLGTYTDTNSTASQTPGDYNWSLIKGVNGVSITSVQTQYYLSTSDASATGGSWSDTQPTFVSGKYYWTRDKITYSNSTTGYSSEIYNQGLTLANEYALSANTAAQSATASANSALKGLGTVENVIDTLNWIATHGEYELTSDQSIVEGKIYYTVTATAVASPTLADIGTYYELVSGYYAKTTDTSIVSGKTYYTVVGAVVANPVVEDIGTYYELVIDDAVANYINTHLSLTNEGLYVMADDTEWKVLIANDGVYIINPNGEQVAKYKEAVTLGIDDGSQSYLSLDYHSMQMIDKEGDTYFYVSDLRNKQGYAELTEVFMGDGRTTSFSVAFNVSQEVSAVDSSNPSNTATRNNRQYTFANAPNDGATVTIVYQTTRPIKAFTFGSRTQNEVVGAFSVAEGNNLIASGGGSHAEGIATQAIGSSSHAEGYLSTATADYSHAEGYMTTTLGKYSHAEGDTTSPSGEASHTEGSNTSTLNNWSHAEGNHSEAWGLSSHAQNHYTQAHGNYQTAIGKFNDNQSGNAFEIGNGTADNARSNALTVDWDGNVETVGDYITKSTNLDRTATTAPSSTINGKQFKMRDMNGEVIADIYPNHVYSGAIQLVERVQRVVSGSTVTNALVLGIDASGNKFYWVTDKPKFRSDMGCDSATNLTAGTLPVARLPVLFKVTSTTSSATSLNYNTGKTITVTVPAQSGYELAGVVGVTSNHGIASSIGGAWVANATNRTVSVNITNRNTSASGNFTDLTVTVRCLWARSEIY